MSKFLSISLICILILLSLLDLRSVFGAGFGYRAIRNDKTELNLFGGATYNRENYSTGVKRNSAELLFGDELKYNLAKLTAEDAKNAEKKI